MAKNNPLPVKVHPHELPFCCPPPGRASWNAHPRVFLPLSATKPVAACPYCGARYELQMPQAAGDKAEAAA